MSNFPKTDTIVQSILDGILEAKTNHTFWTADELYLSYMPENFITIHVAQHIARLQNPPEIFIDYNISEILRCSLPKRDMFKEFMAKRGLSQESISITLDERMRHTSDNDSISKAIIVIKNGVRNAKDEYKNDIHKLCKMLQREKKEDSTLDFGAFAFYLDISSSARKKTQQRIDEIVKCFDEIVKGYTNLKSTFKGGDINTVKNIGEWCVGCYVIEPDIAF